MKNVTVLLVCFFTLQMSAQNWVEEGEDIRFWRETQGTFGDRAGCDIWIYDTDSIVDGQMYQCLSGIYEYSELIESGTIDRGVICLRSEGAQTWFLHNGQEYLLADFNGVVGQQWSIPVEAPSSGQVVPDMLMTVDSTAMIDVGGQARPIMYYTYEFQFDDGCLESGNGSVIRGLFHQMDGSSEFIIPVLPDLACTIDANDLYFFTQFESLDSPSYTESTPGNFNCSSVDVGLDERLQIDMLASPNPTSGIFELTVGNSTAELGQIEIFNALGKTVWAGTINLGGGKSRKTIDLSSQESGMYMLKFTLGQSSSVQRIIIE